MMTQYKSICKLPALAFWIPAVLLLAESILGNGAPERVIIVFAYIALSLVSIYFRRIHFNYFEGLSYLVLIILAHDVVSILFTLAFFIRFRKKRLLAQKPTNNFLSDDDWGLFIFRALVITKLLLIILEVPHSVLSPFTTSVTYKALTLAILLPLNTSIFSSISDFNNLHISLENSKKENSWVLDFMGMMAHNIRTPLTHINSSLQVIQLKTESGMTVKPDDLVKITQSADAASNMITDLLQKTALINSTTYTSIELIEVIARLSKYNIQIENPARVDINLSKTEAISLELVLESILSNAEKYKRSAIYLRIQRNLGNIYLSVQDDGMGMNEAQLKAYGTAQYRTKNTEGSGLGMYLAFSILKNQGWTWDVSSVVNEGTIVTICMPDPEMH